MQPIYECRECGHSVHGPTCLVIWMGEQCACTVDATADDEDREAPTGRTFSVEEIAPGALTSIDLRAEAADVVWGADSLDVLPPAVDPLADVVRTDPRWQTEGLALRITIDGEAQPAEALVVNETQRIGIAWGADASWGDVDLTVGRGIVAAIDDWLNDDEAWEARR